MTRFSPPPAFFADERCYFMVKSPFKTIGINTEGAAFPTPAFKTIVFIAEEKSAPAATPTKQLRQLFEMQRGRGLKRSRKGGYLKVNWNKKKIAEKMRGLQWSHLLT